MATIFSETLPSGDTFHIDTEYHYAKGERPIVQYSVMFNDFAIRNSILEHLLIALAHIVDKGSPSSPFYKNRTDGPRKGNGDEV
jgi:hypothetical protein